MITVIKPKGCKNCKHWGQTEKVGRGMCDLASTHRWKDASQDCFEVIGSVQAFLETGPHFYCCHFKETGT